MKICRNIHRSVWQLLWVEKNKNGDCCHEVQNGRQVKKSPIWVKFGFQVDYDVAVPLDVDVFPIKFHQFLFGE
jgi:hypothetical protein